MERHFSHLEWRQPLEKEGCDEQKGCTLERNPRDRGWWGGSC